MSDKFNLDEFLKKYQGQLESGIRGLAQGGSLGFADELEAAGGAIYEDMKGLVTGKPSEETYQPKLKEARDKYKASEAEYPKTYTTGQIGGSVATSFVPGVAQANAAKLAALGAIQGVGNSEETSVKGLAKDAAVSGALAGTLGYAGNKVIGKLASKFKSSPVDEVMTLQDPDFGAVELTADKLGKLKTAGVKGDLSVGLDDLESSVGQRFQDFIDNSKSKLVNLKHPELGNVEAKLSPTGKILSAGAEGDVHVSPEDLGGLLPNLQSLADQVSKASSDPKIREKFYHVLNEASKKGPQSLAVTQYLLKKDQKGK